MTEESITRVPIKFFIENVGEAEGELIRHLAPRTVDAITKVLPVEGRAALWKEEVYFEIPIKMGDEKAKPKVEKGTIAYWPMGNLENFSKTKSGTIIKIEKM